MDDNNVSNTQEDVPAEEVPNEAPLAEPIAEPIAEPTEGKEATEGEQA